MTARRRDPEERVSDAEREQMVAVLGAHMVSGRLDSDELGARVDAVVAAQTHRELELAMRDLPAVPERPLLVRAAELVPLRVHVIVYVLASATLVGIWAATRERDPGMSDEGFGLLWPFWIMLVWGVFVVAQALYTLRRPLLRSVGDRRAFRK